MKATIRNVENCFTKERGDMTFVAYKYTEKEKKNRPGSENHYGLVIFFNDQYVKSFILTYEEVKLILHWKSNSFLVNDIGYFLKADIRSLTILDLGSHSLSTNAPLKEGGYRVDQVAIWDYFIPLDSRREEEEIKLDLKKTGIAGFKKAIFMALNNPIENDFLVPSSLPKVEHEFVIDYSKSV